MFEPFRIQLSVAVDYAMVGVGEKRKIRRSVVVALLAFHHLHGARDIVRTKSYDLGGLFLTVIQ